MTDLFIGILIGVFLCGFVDAVIDWTSRRDDDFGGGGFA